MLWKLRANFSNDQIALWWSAQAADLSRDRCGALAWLAKSSIRPAGAFAGNAATPSLDLRKF